MRKISIMMSLLATVALLSCSKEPNPPTPEVGEGDAYISLSISAPQVRSTAPTVVVGSEAENAVSEVALLTFDSKYNFIATYTAGVLSTNEAGRPTYNCTVTSDATRFLVIINYKASPKIEQAMYDMNGVGTAANKLYEALSFTQTEVNEMAVSGKFVMINAGSYDLATSVATPLVSLADGQKLSNVAGEPTVVSIPVDRILAKFNYSVTSPLAVPHADDHADVVGVKLHATNKSVYTYSEINTVNSTNALIDYRKDPNMRLDSSTAGTALNWLMNLRDEESFTDTDVTEYVLENTCDGSRQNYNNLTQAVVKAVFTPAELGLAAGESWFSIEVANKGDIEMNFATLVKYYKGELPTETYGTVDSTIKANLDSQLNHILSFSSNSVIADAAKAKSLTWDNDQVTLEALDAVKSGGYRAATAPDGYFISYYQHSINYYDIFIKHDDTVAAGHLGRWGMVRNNAYNMQIQSIKGPGLPYIPSPFDKDIIDPKNPDPEIPEPADVLDAYIEADIVVNGWTTWTQIVDLKSL